MSMKINHELPLPEVLKSQYPLSQELKKVKKQRDEKYAAFLPVNQINLWFL